MKYLKENQKKLKKIGATSAKAVGNAVAVIIEVAQVIVDYATWKAKLRGKVKSGMDEWYKNTVETVTQDLQKLKQQNIDTLKSIINGHADAFEIRSDEVTDNTSALIEQKKQTHKELEENYETRF